MNRYKSVGFSTSGGRDFRAKPKGWRGESHRHYLAAKGVKTTKTRNPDLRVKIPNVKRDGDVKVVLYDEPTEFEKREAARRDLRGKNPENYVVVVETPGKGKRKVIQVEDYLENKARSLGLRTKEEFELYADEFKQGLHDRGVELQHAEKAVAAFAKTLPSRAKAGAKKVGAGAKAVGKAAKKKYAQYERYREKQAHTERGKLKTEMKEERAERMRLEDEREQAYRDVLTYDQKPR